MKKFIFLLIIFLVFVQAGALKEAYQEIFLFEFTLSTETNSVKLKEFSIGQGSPNIFSGKGEDYTLIITTENKSLLLESPIVIPRDPLHQDTLVPCEDIGEPYPGKMCLVGKEVLKTEFEKVMRFPVLKDASFLSILHGNKSIYTIDIKQHFCSGPKDEPAIKLCSAGCGNGLCEKGENQTCPKDCRSASKSVSSSQCGNGLCERQENFQTCLSDCPSGSDDGYCDGIEDVRCDPDCGKDQDTDCGVKITEERKLPLAKIVILTALVVLLGSLLFVIFQKIKSSQ